MKLPPALRHPALWSTLFLIWFVALWLLSSGEMPDLPTNSINKIDKIYHFGYFFGGSGILCAALFTISRGKILPHLLLTAVVFTLTATGALDEWHQSTVPGRSGNDAMDLMADFLGSLVGFYFFRRFRFLLQSDSPTAKESVIFDKKPSK